MVGIDVLGNLVSNVKFSRALSLCSLELVVLEGGLLFTCMVLGGSSTGIAHYFK